MGMCAPRTSEMAGDVSTGGGRGPGLSRVALRRSASATCSASASSAARERRCELLAARKRSVGALNNLGDRLLRKDERPRRASARTVRSFVRVNENTCRPRVLAAISDESPALISSVFESARGSSEYEALGIEAFANPLLQPAPGSEVLERAAFQTAAKTCLAERGERAAETTTPVRCVT